MTKRQSVCVLGTGAVGSLLGAALLAKGYRLTFIDHGRRLAALRRDGLRIVGLDGDMQSIEGGNYQDPNTVDGPFDIVILAVKAHQIVELVPCLQRILGDASALLTLQNGLPWWYFQGDTGPLSGTVLECLDPGGVIAAAVPHENNRRHRRIPRCRGARRRPGAARRRGPFRPRHAGGRSNAAH